MKQLIHTAVLLAAAAAACGAEEGAFGALQASLPHSREIAAPPAPGRADKSLNSAQLTELLWSPDPEIRKAAVRSAANHIQNSYANEPLLRIFADRAERADIRVEAARALSGAAGYLKVQNAFTGLLERGAEPLELRVMTYKALYSAAAASPRLQEFLLAAVRRNEKDPAARRAAVWALFPAAQTPRVQAELAGLAGDGEDELTRIEAVKSLYGANGTPRVKELFRELAHSAVEPKPVRAAAILALSGTQDSSVERFLLNLIRTEQDPELRAAAVSALEPDQARLRDYFHLGYRLQNGAYVSPLEKE